MRHCGSPDLVASCTCTGCKSWLARHFNLPVVFVCSHTHFGFECLKEFCSGATCMSGRSKKVWFNLYKSLTQVRHDWCNCNLFWCRASAGGLTLLYNIITAVQHHHRRYQPDMYTMRSSETSHAMHVNMLSVYELLQVKL